MRITDDSWKKVVFEVKVKRRVYISETPNIIMVKRIAPQLVKVKNKGGKKNAYVSTKQK